MPTVPTIEASDLILRCTVCHRTEPVGDVAQRERDGWPRCCGEVLYIAVPRVLRASLDPGDA